MLFHYRLHVNTGRGKSTFAISGVAWSWMSFYYFIIVCMLTQVVVNLHSLYQVWFYLEYLFWFIIVCMLNTGRKNLHSLYRVWLDLECFFLFHYRLDVNTGRAKSIFAILGQERWAKLWCTSCDVYTPSRRWFPFCFNLRSISAFTHYNTQHITSYCLGFEQFFSAVERLVVPSNQYVPWGYRYLLSKKTSYFDWFEMRFLLYLEGGEKGKKSRILTIIKNTRVKW